jgi:hypothetical protein
MIKLSAISPKTIVSMGGDEGSSTPEEAQLKELLSQMAYSMLQSKAPNLAPYITSFKPLELDLDSNKAVGAFSLDLNGKNIMIPIVMSDGKVKPPEVFYSKEQDAFLPLNNKWMEEIQKAEAANLGENVEAPESLSGDVDIRALTLPPTTGRFVYASYRDIHLPSVIDNCDNLTKVAFSEVLKKNSGILKALVKYNGAGAVELLRPRHYATKVASVATKQWAVLDSASPKSEYVKFFGEKYASAYSKALNVGFVATDFRKQADILVDTEVPLDSSVMAQSGITEPNFPGVYNIAKLDGKTDKVFIVPNPFMAGEAYGDSETDNGNAWLKNYDTEAGKLPVGKDYGMRNTNKSKAYLVVDSSKRVGVFRKIVALSTTENLDTSSVMSEAMSERKPKNGDKLFVSIRNGEITNAAYFPEGISNVTDTGSGDILAQYMGRRVVFTSSRAVKVPKIVSSSANFTGGMGSNVGVNVGDSTYIVPITFTPISVSGSIDQSEYIEDADILRNTIMEKVSSLAKSTLRVKRSSDGSWAVNGQYFDDKKSALSKIASLGINVVVANDSISKIKLNSSKVFHAIPPRNIVKLSSIFGPDQAPPAPQGMPPEQMGGMPPQGMPPEQMGGMPPQGMPPEQMGGMPPQGMPPEQMGGMPPQAQQTMQAAANLNDESIFNASAAASLLQYNPLNEAVAQELPNIEKALDSTARILVSVQMREAELVSQIGQDSYNELESNLRKVLGGLGDIILTLHKQKSMTSLPEGISGGM